MRALFLNENLGGHAAMHRYLRQALADVPSLQPSFFDVPPPNLLRKLAAAPVPGLARSDLDLQPLRYQLAQSAAVRRRIERLIDCADVVHVYTQNAALLVSRQLGTVPTVVSTDSTNEQNGYQLPYRKATRWTPLTVAATKRFEKRVFAAATLVVAQSQWAATSLVESYGVDPERIRTIRFGVPVRPMRERVETDLPEITFVGTSMSRKGGFRLLDAYRRALRGRALLNLVTHEAVDEQPGVRVFGDIRPGDERLDEILARTAVFALPSEIDKSSWAVLEAMAAGAPAIVGQTGGMGELVEHGVSGLVVDPRDDDALCAALVALVDDAPAREEMGRQARLRVETHFDAARTTRQLIDVLEEAVVRFGQPR